jgi:hypothetical protein
MGAFQVLEVEGRTKTVVEDGGWVCKERKEIELTFTEVTGTTYVNVAIHICD